MLKRIRDLFNTNQTDPMTGLATLASLSKALDASLKRREEGQAICVCSVDLDNFSNINIAYGIKAGNEILITVGQRLKAAIGTAGMVARVSGDEFLLIFNKITNIEDTAKVLNYIKETISKPIFLKETVANVSLTASMGATIYPLDNYNGDTLIRHANQALYLAKQSGKNKFHIFDAASNKVVETEFQKCNRMHQAIAKGELELYYQPKVDLSNGDVAGMEALLRWNHPELGLLTPVHFEKELRATIIGVEIGNFVIEAAIRQMAGWLRHGLKMPVSVNLTASHLVEPGFLELVQAIFARFPNVEPSMLEIEILESDAIQDVNAVRAKIIEYQRFGLKFSLDDFGTGYSSLSYLKMLPAEKMKIDKSFVIGMLTNDEDMALASMAIKLARVFKCEVVAEGVETIEHGVVLKQIGCRYAQGYVIAKPMPAYSVKPWISKYRPFVEWMDAVAV